MSALSDTLVALATPAGTAALAVLRVSGPDSARLYQEVFHRAPAARRVQHVTFRSAQGETLDEGLAVFFQGPASYTGEDSFEYTAHGNPLLVQRLLGELLAKGARSAEPGEFTRRAFTHGKLDLAQAEAVADLIHARSERAIALANQQLKGALGRHIEGLKQQTLEALARIEAYIDFPEEDLPPEDQRLVDTLLEGLERGTARLLATQRYGELLREGIRTVIVGEPNAGKSSLLNALVGHDRALVSPEPGTTRDFIEEVLHIGGHCLRLIDTAGLNPSPTPLEERGMAKTLERAAQADLFLIVQDHTQAPPVLPAVVRERLTPANTVWVLNKADLPAAPRPDALPYPTVRTSALTGSGLSELEAAITARAEGFRQDQSEDQIAINSRHADALQRARSSLARARQHLLQQGPTELLSSDVREALEALGEIGGRVDNERMLDALFATFCIGK